MTIFWLDRKLALERAKEAAGRVLAECPDVVRVGIFGSVATGRAVPGSDVDVLIVLSQSDERPLDRPARFQPYFETVGLPVDLFCFTEDEAAGSRFFQTAAAQAVWVR
ncbi:MAG: nucleotidyltransferase domain-containing protein [Planctomycetes bacterium]|nr:nucleotidyltransferase domain-containing protein [Planctomycetota bacterium]